MSSGTTKRIDTMNGLLFVALFALAARYFADLPALTSLAISPLVVGIILGMTYGNTLRPGMPASWTPGLRISTRYLLRLGIILYGFRLTFRDVAEVGAAGCAMSVTMVFTTFALGAFVGIRLLKMDRDTALLTAAGSSVCGAAAVLATEPVLQAKPHKSAVAVSTVVLFGTLTMFLYPALFHAGFFSVDDATFGIYIGGTIHEVAHAVAAGNAVSEPAAANAIIVKMIRVMMIAPLLLVLSMFTAPKEGGGRRKITIPWFAVIFILVTVFNTFDLLPHALVQMINRFDTFILTMAMCALGIDTNFASFKEVGHKPFVLATILWFWLTCGGYWIMRGWVALL